MKGANDAKQAVVEKDDGGSQGERYALIGDDKTQEQLLRESR